MNSECQTAHSSVKYASFAARRRAGLGLGSTFGLGSGLGFSGTHLVPPGRRRDEDGLRDALPKLVVREGSVVKRRWQPEAVLDEAGLT